MAIFSTLYTSVSLLPTDDWEEGVARIVGSAQHWNRVHDITGVLIFASTGFAQLLEGEEQAVRALMARIVVDPRHEQVRVAVEEQRAERRVPRWSLAYAGPSSFVAGFIAPLMAERAERNRSRAATRLIDLMVEAARNGMSRITSY